MQLLDAREVLAAAGGDKNASPDQQSAEEKKESQAQSAMFWLSCGLDTACGFACVALDLVAQILPGEAGGKAEAPRRAAVGARAAEEGAAGGEGAGRWFLGNITACAHARPQEHLREELAEEAAGRCKHVSTFDGVRQRQAQNRAVHGKRSSH